MIRFILKLFATKTLVAELVQREFPDPTVITDATAWKKVYFHVPEMHNWLVKREINLLRSFALKEKSQEFILGQIAEIKLAQAFDVPSESKPVDLGKPEPVKTISRKGFLSGWNKTDANA